MHGLDDFLQNLTIVLATAAVVAVLFQKLRQPVVLGAFLAGSLMAEASDEAVRACREFLLETAT